MGTALQIHIMKSTKNTSVGHADEKKAHGMRIIRMYSLFKATLELFLTSHRPDISIWSSYMPLFALIGPFLTHSTVHCSGLK